VIRVHEAALDGAPRAFRFAPGHLQEHFAAEVAVLRVESEFMQRQVASVEENQGRVIIGIDGLLEDGEFVRIFRFPFPRPRLRR
jgi:hypothetical protein